jgi:enediyne biosynthesis protein E4
LAAGDVNNDGDDDIFISGSKGNRSSLWLSSPAGYALAKQQPWNNDLSYEVVNAIYFDANSDGLMDLYLASGSNEFNLNDACQQDRLFINKGDGAFKYEPEALPQMYTSTKAIAVNDIDNDGDMDLFVGGFVEPRAYGISPRSYLLVNTNGKFIDATMTLAPELENPGMINSAIWADLDGDKVLDLVLGGEYMPIGIFVNKKGLLSPLKVAENGLEGENGWWHSLAAHDFDGDGDMDFIAGNHGLNVIFDCSKEAPTILYVNDFDKNGSLDPVLTCDINGVRAPFLSRDIVCEQMPEYNNKFLTNTMFANTPFDSMFSADLLAGAKKLVLSQLRSGYFENLGGGKFAFKPFENIAQLGPIYGIQLLDANNDGFMDALVAGNSNTDHYLYGNADASSGLLLLNDGKGNFTYKQHTETGFNANKKGRGLVKVTEGGQTYYIVPNNNDTAQVFKFTPMLLN